MKYLLTNEIVTNDIISLVNKWNRERLLDENHRAATEPELGDHSNDGAEEQDGSVQVWSSLAKNTLIQL